jgi:hypothetical protein
MAQKNDQPPASPTLIPALPSPIPPTTSSAATSEELSFFDRAKKSISNKNTFNEFLKLCNLFSQDLVDRTVLVHRARSFIGTNPELMKWFQDFIGYDEKDVIVENKARIPGGRVSLSNCRGLGPSYRLLPKRVCCLFFSFLFFVILARFYCSGLCEVVGFYEEIQTRNCDRTANEGCDGLRNGLVSQQRSRQTQRYRNHQLAKYDHHGASLPRSPATHYTGLTTSSGYTFWRRFILSRDPIVLE